MLLAACQMVAYSYNLETDNDFARIMAMLVAVHSARLCSLLPLALHNLCRSEDKLLAEECKEDSLVLHLRMPRYHEVAHPTVLLFASGAVGMRNPPEELQEKHI